MSKTRLQEICNVYAKRLSPIRRYEIMSWTESMFFRVSQKLVFLSGVHCHSDQEQFLEIIYNKMTFYKNNWFHKTLRLSSCKITLFKTWISALKPFLTNLIFYINKKYILFCQWEWQVK